MVATVILTEPMMNAIGAALDEHNKRLVSALVRAKSLPESPDRDFAIECNEAAIRDGIVARLTIAAAAEDDADFPEALTYAAWAEGELREAFGR